MKNSLLLGLIAVVPFLQDGQDQKEAPAATQEYEVKKGSIVPTLDLDATFESRQSFEVKLNFEAYQGELTLTKIAAMGEAVKKDQPIFEMDRTPIERQIRSAENELRVAKSTLQKAKADRTLGQNADGLAMTEAETALKNAETDLKIFDEVDGRHMLLNADLNLKYAEDGVNDQKDELDQLEKMYKSEELTNATSEIVVKRARRSLERAKTSLEMTRENTKIEKEIRFPRERLAKARAVESAKQNVESLKVAHAHNEVSRTADVFRAEMAVVTQEEQFDKLGKDAQKFSVKAPFDGRIFYGQLQAGGWASAEVLAQSLKPGEKLAANTVVLTVCGSELDARAWVPEASYLDVAPGQSVGLTPNVLADVKLDGSLMEKSVAGIAGQAGNSFDLKIALKNSRSEILPGMKAKACISFAKLENVILIPANAITAAPPKSYVTVTKDGKTEQREVTVGKTDGKMTEIKGGLNAGEKIVAPK